MNYDVPLLVLLIERFKANYPIGKKVAFEPLIDGFEVYFETKCLGKIQIKNNKIEFSPPLLNPVLSSGVITERDLAIWVQNELLK